MNGTGSPTCVLMAIGVGWSGIASTRTSPRASASAMTRDITSRVDRLDGGDLRRHVACVALLVRRLHVDDDQVVIGKRRERTLGLPRVVVVRAARHARDLEPVHPRQHRQPAEQVDTARHRRGHAALLGEGHHAAWRHARPERPDVGDG